MSSSDASRGTCHGHAMEELALSLSGWEEQTLDSIKDELTDSDPKLVKLLTGFTQLVSGEAMPVREKLRAGSRRMIRYAPGKQRPCCQTGACRNSVLAGRNLSLQYGLPLLWLLVTVTLITVALVLGRGGGQETATQTCTGSWPAACSYSPPG
jgi:hypothetical protein